MNVLLQIFQGVNLLLALIVPVEELAAKIKDFFSLNPDIKINVQHLSSAALQADADTLAKVAQWQKDHGLPVTVPAPTPITDVPAAPAGS